MEYMQVQILIYLGYQLTMSIYHYLQQELSEELDIKMML
ncbi:Uncharacterised protein [Proteus mirabilis]|uniref:Uncharacterized protein n=1 Tax=Proteus mirabilis TaxID=584 RepID=A0A379FIG0_PROMI|nr:Uncharacterised protein [Proteus mirabilis]